MRAKQGFTHKDFAHVLNKYKYHLSLGDIVAGTIFSEEEEGFLVDIGAKIAAYLPKEETSLNRNPFSNSNIINETREFFILAYNKKRQQLIISIRRLDYIRGWKRIKQMQAEDILINLSIYNINKGGLLTQIEGIQGFIPNSHLVNAHNKKPLLNKQLKCQFLIADEKSNKLIFSNKRAMLTMFSQSIQVGQIIYGTITQIKTYGLFININKITALLHISEIGDKYINSIENIFTVGNQIKVKIIHIDKKRGRLSVSRRNLN
uniref:Small ribosomal subunit protein bS1c n=1 Tax=Rhodogorgon sp. TaxID=2485824 RepID=A0A3G3MHS6_9FLOR|nr:ribosomal protein S1 [Rhodogorgon sp.]